MKKILTHAITVSMLFASQMVFTHIKKMQLIFLNFLSFFSNQFLRKKVAIAISFLLVIVSLQSFSQKCPSSNSVTPSANQNVCVGQPVNILSDVVSYTGTGTQATPSYQWYYNTTSSNTIFTATKINGATSSTYTPPSTVNESGNRYYFCVGYNFSTCGTTDISQSLASNVVKVTVNALPVVSAPASICVGNTATLSPTTGGTWASSDNTKASVTNAGVITGISAGSVTFTFTATSTGCSQTTSSVTVNALPVVSAPASICVG
ncbi:MAG TPA: hypothetical protein PLP23_10665, partial [Panacibacter sp.]|nr:hypothetical protein [Panacibacter sp.]